MWIGAVRRSWHPGGSGDWARCAIRRSLFIAFMLSWGLAATAVAQCSPPASTRASKLTYCYSTYALCTIAKCKAPPDKSPIPSEVECDCTVATGYSVGEACVADPNPRCVISRYHPVRSYQQCPGMIGGKRAVWANCLNAPCTIDANNPGSAKCVCPTATSTSPFVVVSDRPNPAACRACTVDSGGHYDCPSGLFSSARTEDSQKITTFIQDTIGEITVFSPPPK